MFKNFFKIILRDLSKDKVYTLISILGLSAGICVAVLILTINYTYTSFDRFHEKGSRIYQAFTKNDFLEKGIEIGSNMPCLLGESLNNDYPEVENTATVMYDFSPIFVVGNIKAEQSGCYSNPGFFDIFSFKILAAEKSNQQKVFIDKNSISVSRTTAEKYFGSVYRALGKKIDLTRTYEKEEVYVSSVFEDMPYNSSIKYDYVLPLEKLLEKQPWQKHWGNFNAAGSYILLKPGVNIEEFNSKVKQYIHNKHQYSNAGLFFYNFENVFLNPPYGFSKTTVVKMLYVIAAIILIIASINFINLATSRASKKGKEIGLRKVIGASRKSLIIRFLSETFLLSFIALVLGLLLAELLVPYINFISASFFVIKIPYNNLYFILSLTGLWLFMGFMSGIYPSIYLSGLTPGAVIKGHAGPGGKLFIRRALITLQFGFSALFIFLTIVVYNQMKYVTNKNLGINIKQVLEFPLTKNITEHFSAFSNDLKKKSGIHEVTCAGFEPVGVGMTTSDPAWEGKPANMNDMFPVLTVGDNFVKAFDVKVILGRDFFEGDSADANNFLINEEMEKIIHKSYKGSVVGIGLSMWQINGRIVGVVKNFHSASLYQTIGPLIIWKNENSFNKCFVRFNASAINTVIPYLKSVYDKYETDYPLSYKFLDELYLSQHSDTKTFVGLFSLFSTIAIVISCLGLFGLTAFNIQQKTKEVGIRKVLGASVSSLSVLLTKSIIRMVIISSALALPVGYILANKLLDMFVYKTSIDIYIYLFTFGIIALLAAITVIFQVIKAALANPVKSLKYE